MKKLIAICCVLIVMMIVFFGVKAYREMHKESYAEQNEEVEGGFPGERGVRILREKDPTDIIWYGKRYAYPNRYPFEFNVPVRYENEWSDGTLKIRKGFNRAIIVISDRKGDYSISTEALEACILRAIQSDRYYFLYLGADRIDEILDVLRKNTDYFTELNLYDKDSLGSLGIFKRADGNMQYDFNPVIEASDPEEDGWIWEYFADAAAFGMFDGSFWEKVNQ